MAGSTAKTRTGAAQTGPAIIKFVIPSTGQHLLTRQPAIENVGAVSNILMEGYPDADQILAGDDEAAKNTMAAHVSNGLMTWFARYCVIIPRDSQQWQQTARKLRQKWQQEGTPIPTGRALLGAVVLLGLLPGEDDKRSFLAHMCALSGLVNFMPAPSQTKTLELATQHLMANNG